MPRRYRLEGEVDAEHNQAGDQRDQRLRPINPPRPFGARRRRYRIRAQDLGVRVGARPRWHEYVVGQTLLEGCRDLRAALPVPRTDMQPETIARQQRSAAVVPGQGGDALGVGIVTSFPGPAAA